MIDDLPAKAADVNEEKKGPRVGAPDQAMQGFLKSAGLTSIDQAQIVEDKKGDFYVARIERAGRETPRDPAGDHPGNRARVSVAEIDALGNRAISHGCGRCTTFAACSTARR